MSREEFVSKYRHELAGLVLDGCTVNRTGSDLALFVRTIMHKIDQRLGAIYADLTQPDPAANGAAKPPQRGTR